MKKLTFQLFVFSFLATFLIGTPAFADVVYKTDPKAQDAKALVEKAVTFFKTHDAKESFAHFNDKINGYTNSEIYLGVSDEKGLGFAHRSPGVIGKNLWEIKNPAGEFVMQKMIKTAQAHPNGQWLTYSWFNAKTQKTSIKHTYVKLFKGYVFSSGFYEE